MNNQSQPTTRASQAHIFSYNGSDIRITIDENGLLWWAAKDVCQILGLKNHLSKTVVLDNEDTKLFLFETPGGPQKIRCVNEAGLYALIFSTRKPDAINFKRWVLKEVLPKMRLLALPDRP